MTAADLQREELDWPAGTVPEVAGSEPPVGRAKTALRAGDVLSQARLVAADERVQGDAVTARLLAGGVAIETPAVLAANALVGHTARVQLAGRRELLEGVLVDSGTVLIEH